MIDLIVYEENYYLFFIVTLISSDNLSILTLSDEQPNELKKSDGEKGEYSVNMS